MELNEKLKIRRLELGLTLEDISKTVGVSAPTIYRWESGDIGNMRRDRIVLYAKALKVPPDFIMEWENDDPRSVLPSAEDLKFALFNGSDGITDEMFEEVKNFAKMVKLREAHKNKKR
ncbi:MAG: helix-turn-helix domain-containing protein [Eubacterium sp.]|jgi:transcriptional regulator with XRE-family HTH domain|nr:helix-turn-helix domain-containing protein [Eubacterium sp.]